MAKVYAAVRGGSVRVGSYGLATDTVPVEVPAEVGLELSTNSEVRVELEAPVAAAPEADVVEAPAVEGRRKGR